MISTTLGAFEFVKVGTTKIPLYPISITFGHFKPMTTFTFDFVCLFAHIDFDLIVHEKYTASIMPNLLNVPTKILNF